MNYTIKFFNKYADYYSIINLVGKYGDKLDKMALDKYNDIYEKAQMLYNEQKKKESVGSRASANAHGAEQFCCDIRISGVL